MTRHHFFLLCFNFFSHGNSLGIYRGNISVGKIPQKFTDENIPSVFPFVFINFLVVNRAKGDILVSLKKIIVLPVGNMLTELFCWHMSVADYGICSKFFSTLWSIQTDCVCWYPHRQITDEIIPSMIVAYVIHFFHLSRKYQRIETLVTSPVIFEKYFLK
jgi:hypothetical protein